MTNRIIIVTAGPFARELQAWCQHRSASTGDVWNIVGFLDVDPNALDGTGIGLPILGDEDSAPFNPDDRFVMGAADPALKARLSEKIKSRGGQFIPFVHPSAVTAPGVSMGEGVVIGPNAVLAANVRVGNFATINFSAGIGHDTALGDFSTVNPGAQIGGNCVIGEGALIGSGGVLLQEINVGKDAVVGSGSVVMTNVKDGATVLGNPAKRLKT